MDSVGGVSSHGALALEPEADGSRGVVLVARQVRGDVQVAGGRKAFGIRTGGDRRGQKHGDTDRIGSSGGHSATTSEAVKPRDPMAPDTEPTDEELALVMREARELAVQRRAKADAWIAARLEEAAQFGRENTRAGRTRDR